MSWHALCDDMRQVILRSALEDTHGNITVPGLVLGTALRRVSKAVAAQLVAVKTPYDAEVTYEGNWPVHFVGGHNFGEGGPPGDAWGGFYVVRDPRSGHVFACTVKYAIGGGGPCARSVRSDALEVDRLWPLWRLAQLVNGHCTDFSKRLPDLVAVAGNEERLVAKHEILGPNLRDFGWDVIRKHNQLETISHNGLDAPPCTHSDDFISHVVRKRGWGIYLVKHPELVLCTTLDYGYDLFALTSVSDAPADVNAPRSTFAHDERVPPLGVALGWYDHGEVVQATGWMTSLYCHGREGVPTHYTRALPEQLLRRMGVLAERRAEKLRMEAARAARAARGGGKKRKRPRDDGPAARVGRLPRSAALKAKKKMNDQLQYDAWQHADGRFFSYLKPKEERDVHDDDQYAAPGAQVTPEYTSDGEYSPDGEGRDVAPAEWRQRNYEAEVAKARQDYHDMLEPSDNEESCF